MGQAILNQPHFQDADKAREYLEALRWPNGPICPHCGVIGHAYKLEGKAHRPGLYNCNECRQQFSVTVGTVFDDGKIALNRCMLATFLMAPGQCDWLTGQSIMMDGGQALATGGNFYELRQWSDADWLAARERIEAQNQKDKAQR